MELETSKNDVAKSPWGKVARPSSASASLTDIMSEQLAVDLHDKYVVYLNKFNNCTCNLKRDVPIWNGCCQK